jgi:hypothetical protein
MILTSISFIIKGQSVHPELGLHGQVTWLSDTKIRVEYDWSNDDQLMDWTTTNGSTLVRGDGTLTITDGVASVRSMVWRQFIKCTRIYSQNAKTINSPNAHLNFVTNITGWTGYNFNPPEIIGLIYVSNGNLWLENGTHSSLPSPPIVLGNNYTIDLNISETLVTAKSSSDNIVYSYNLKSPPDPDRQVAIGGWGGDTEWGKLTIEGEINITWQTPADMIDIESGGAVFSPVIEVEGNPLIEWIFYDGTTTSSTKPVKDYGSIATRHNLLRVTPWSALIGINVGYDGADGGYGGFEIVGNQTILGFQNLSLAKGSLKYLCANYSPLTDLDLTEFTALKFVELLLCQNLATLKLGIHPLLERLCVEDDNLSSLDLSGCPALGDIRSAENRFTSINWGDIGASLWHICVRSNPQFSVNLPDLTRFPILRELLIWDDNQTGSFVCHNSFIQRIEAYDNYYTSADISSCISLIQFSLSGSKLSSLNLGTANSLILLQLKDCDLSESLTDYVLQTLDIAGHSNGQLDLSGNAAPSGNGMAYYNNLKLKGWTISINESGQLIPITGIAISGAGGITSINTDNGTLQLYAEISPPDATDKTITWTIISGSGLAAIDSTGLVTASGNGTITVRGTANDGSGIYGELMIVISNQGTSENGSFSSIGKIIVTRLELKILLNNDFNSWESRLYNLNGILVSSIFVDSNVLVFDISKLAPGIYLIVLSKGGNLKVAEFIKL